MKKVISLMIIMTILMSGFSFVYASNEIENSTPNPYATTGNVTNIPDNTENTTQIDSETAENETTGNTVLVSGNITKESLENAAKKHIEYLRKNGNTQTDYKIYDDKIVLSNGNSDNEASYDLQNGAKFSTNIVMYKDGEYKSGDDKILEISAAYVGLMLSCEIKGASEKNAGDYVIEEISKNNMLMFLTVPYLPNDVAKYYLKEEVVENHDLYTSKIKILSDSDSELIVNLTLDVKVDQDFSVINDKYENYKSFDDMLEELKKSRENYTETAKKENEQLANVMAFANEMGTNKGNMENITEIPQTGKGFETVDALEILLVTSIFLLGGYAFYNIRKNKKEG